MARADGRLGSRLLNLTSEEKRAYGPLFKAADRENVGVVTGEVAAKFFERSGLDPRVLGKVRPVQPPTRRSVEPALQAAAAADLPSSNAQIWEIADTENRGFLTPAGFGVVLRLIAHVQNGREAIADLAFRRKEPWFTFESVRRPTGVGAD